MRVPLARRYSGSAYHMDNRCTIVTRLKTDSGVTSEVFNGDADTDQDRILAIIHDELAPLLSGRSAANPEGCWQAMEPATNNILRDRGLALQAIACLDTAVWDVFARSHNSPLHRLWGSCRDAIPVSVIGGYYHLDLGEIRDLMQKYASMGFAGCKFKVGGLSPAEDAKRVRAACNAVDGNFALMVDANQGYTREEAVEFGRHAADLGLRWFEEPCRWTNDRRWMRDVRLQTGIPIVAGQSETTLAGLRDLIVDGAIDVSNFDASWSGGPTIWKKAVGLAVAFGVDIGHHEESQIAGQLLATVVNGTYVECFDEERDPLLWNVQVNPPDIADGLFRLPAGPGFGIEIDWSYLEPYVVSRRSTPVGDAP